MNQLFEWLARFAADLKFFVVVQPWERAVRVRFGKRLTVLSPGWNLRIPIVDQCHIMNSKLRVADTGALTLTTMGGKVLTVSMTIGFCIDDPVAALLQFQHPENSFAAVASSELASAVSSMDEPKVHVLEQTVSAALIGIAPYKISFVRIRDFAYVKAFRILQEQSYRGAGLQLEDRRV